MVWLCSFCFFLFVLLLCAVKSMALDPTERDVLRKFHCKLAENIDVKVILPYMKDIIDAPYVDQICSQKTSFGQAEKLLSLVSKGGSATFAYFMKALDLRYPHFAISIKQELKTHGSRSPSLFTRKISGQALKEQVIEEKKQRRNSNGLILPHYSIRMDPRLRQIESDIIRKYRLHLHAMNTNKILPLCDSIKDKYHSELINAEKAPFQKAEKLLDILAKLGPKAFEEFVNALYNVNPELGSPILDELRGSKVLVISS